MCPLLTAESIFRKLVKLGLSLMQNRKYAPTYISLEILNGDVPSKLHRYRPMICVFPSTACTKNV